VRGALTAQQSGNTNTLPHHDHLALTTHAGKIKTTTLSKMTGASPTDPLALPTTTDEDRDHLEQRDHKTDITTPEIEAGRAIGLENETAIEIATDTGSARRMEVTEEVLPTTVVAEQSANVIDLDHEHDHLNVMALAAVLPTQLAHPKPHHHLCREHSCEAAHAPTTIELVTARAE
jgi:hypothetical protein